MDELFSRMYEADVKGGRPSVPPEKLLRAMLLQILFSIEHGREEALAVGRALQRRRHAHPGMGRAQELRTQGQRRRCRRHGGFKGETRSNETHESKTDPDSRLFRKGKTAS